MVKNIRKSKKVISKLKYMFLLSIILLLNNSVAFASGGTATYGGFDKLFEMFAGIIQKVGGGVGLIGAVFFGMGIYQDNPDGKVKGVKMLAAGAFLFAVATGYKSFLV
jgi:hypothetical protein